MNSGKREFLTPPEIPAPTEDNHPARLEDVPLASDETPQALGSAATVSGGEDLYGYIDEVRILLNSARWTSNFTQPKKPYLPA